MDQFELEQIAKNIRYELVSMSYQGKAPHLGSALSCVDLLVAAYWNFLKIDPKRPKDRSRDRFILSKGHAIAIHYAVLAYRGFFPKSLLETFNQNGSSLPEHPTPKCIAGIEVATGSLGHGLSFGAGIALAGKILQETYRVMVLLSDGECNEGSIWEAALFSPKKGLNQLIAVIDYNKWQATGRSDDVLELSPLKEKWESFGWQTYEIDGNDMKQILDTFAKIPNAKSPIAIIAHTVKGKGLSFMEDDNNWHYKIPTKEDVLKAKLELGV